MKAHKNLQKGMNFTQTNLVYHIFPNLTRGKMDFSLFSFPSCFLPSFWYNGKNSTEVKYMYKYFPTLTERPEINNSIAALVYQVIGYYSIPFMLLLLLQGGIDGILEVAAAVELAFHAFNFFVALFIFREYLTDTFADLRHGFKRLMKTVSLSTALIFLLAVVGNALFGFSSGLTSLTAYGALPLTEVDLFILPCDVVFTYPLLGTLCLGFLAPVTISCLYYGAVFAPICYTRPMLAYIATALFLAFPRYCNAATFWDPSAEWTLYFTQLPLHMIACWSYQKTDSIWAPILTHWIVNLLSCALIVMMRLMSGM